MKTLNRQVEWTYMQKVVSQGPQYVVFAVCVGAVAVAAAIGAFEEKLSTPLAYMSSQIPVIASAGTPVVVELQPPTF